MWRNTTVRLCVSCRRTHKSKKKITILLILRKPHPCWPSLPKQVTLTWWHLIISLSLSPHDLAVYIGNISHISSHKYLFIFIFSLRSFTLWVLQAGLRPVLDFIVVVLSVAKWMDLFIFYVVRKLIVQCHLMKRLPFNCWIASRPA